MCELYKLYNSVLIWQPENFQRCILNRNDYVYTYTHHRLSYM